MQSVSLFLHDSAAVINLLVQVLEGKRALHGSCRPLAKTARFESSYALVLRVLVLWCALLNVTQSRTPGVHQWFRQQPLRPPCLKPTFSLPQRVELITSSFASYTEVLRVRVLGTQMVMWSMLHTLGLTTCLCEKTEGGEVIRTQTRPAIEFVSGEDGLRPKSYFLVFAFVEYAFTDALKYTMAPGPSCGAEGRTEQCCRGTALSVSVCVVLFVTLLFPLKDVFKSLPSRAAALVAGVPHCQLRTE